MNDKYHNIINLPHPISKKHPKMSLYNRAAQFAPFAALNGYENALEETLRKTRDKTILSEEMKNEINDKLLVINSNINKKPTITITYYIPDDKKRGGNYHTITNSIKRIDLDNNKIVFTDNTKILIDDIFDINLDYLDNTD